LASFFLAVAEVDDSLLYFKFLNRTIRSAWLTRQYFELSWMIRCRPTIQIAMECLPNGSGVDFDGKSAALFLDACELEGGRRLFRSVFQPPQRKGEKGAESH
jgi:hypothetical protein